MKRRHDGSKVVLSVPPTAVLLLAATAFVLVLFLQAGVADAELGSQDASEVPSASAASGGSLLQDVGFDATWKIGNLSDAQLRWHPFVNGFRPSVNPKLGGPASVALSPHWPSGAFQFVPGASLPPDARQYTFSVWTLVEESLRKQPVPRHLGNVTIDIAYVSGGRDSFSATIMSGSGHDSSVYQMRAEYDPEEEGSEQDWAAERFATWREEWRQHCYTFDIAPKETIESITIFLLSSQAQLQKKNTIQLWADQANLFAGRRDPVESELQCSQLAPKLRIEHSVSDRYRLYEAACRATHAPSPSEVTLIVHLSLDQLSLLNGLATSWKGPISAAVLMSSVADLAELNHLHSIDPHINNWVTLHAVHPANVEDVTQYGYPSGFLRRIATEAATTINVLQFDINFLAMPRLRAVLEEYSTVLEFDKHVYVLPGYAAHDTANAVPTNEQILLENLRKGRLYQVRSSVDLRPNWKHDETSRAARNASQSALRAPLLMLPKALSRFDDSIEGLCGIDLDMMKVALDMEGYRFAVLPRGYAMRVAPEPWHERECYPTADLRPWRVWYTWLVSASIKREGRPSAYYYREIGDPYSRGRGIVGVIRLMIDREPFFLWLFIGSCVLAVLLIYCRKLRERRCSQQSGSLHVLPLTRKGD